MEMTLNSATYCFGGAAFFYLWSWKCKRQAQTLANAVRVKELQELGGLIDNNNTSSLLVVSGKVGSNEAFMCKRSGVMAVSLTEMAKLVFSTENEANYSKMDSDEIVVNHKTGPLVSDETGRVNVVAFYDTLERNVFDEPTNKLFQRVLHRKRVDAEGVLEIGTPLSIVAKAFRGRDGDPTIRAPPSQVFNGYRSFEKVVSNLESQSECFRHLSFVLAVISLFLLT